MKPKLAGCDVDNLALGPCSKDDLMRGYKVIKRVPLATEEGPYPLDFHFDSLNTDYDSDGMVLSQDDPAAEHAPYPNGGVLGRNRSSRLRF